MKMQIRNIATNVILASFPDELGPWYFLKSYQDSALRSGFDPGTIVVENHESDKP